MRNLILLLTFGLTGCSVATLQMQVPASLESNAISYSISKGKPWEGKGQTLSFGPHATKGATWIRTRERDSEGLLSLGNLFNIEDAEAIKSEITKSHQFDFVTQDNETWNANCALSFKQREQMLKGTVLFKNLDASYQCRFTNARKDYWELNIVESLKDGRTIEMANFSEKWLATPGKSQFVRSNGKVMKLARAPDNSSFIWQSGSDQISAVALNSKPPKLWISKTLEPDYQHAMAMANAGLLIYFWNILPTLPEQ